MCHIKFRYCSIPWFISHDQLNLIRLANPHQVIIGSIGHHDVDLT